MRYRGGGVGHMHTRAWLKTVAAEADDDSEDDGDNMEDVEAELVEGPELNDDEVLDEESVQEPQNDGNNGDEVLDNEDDEDVQRALGYADY